MGKQTGSRTVNSARYEELLREELEKYNDELGPHDQREIFFDALLCRRRVTSQMRWRVFLKLRELGFSLPAIAKVAGYHHTTVLHGLYVLTGDQRRRKPSVRKTERGLRKGSVRHVADLNSSAGTLGIVQEQTADASLAALGHSP